MKIPKQSPLKKIRKFCVVCCGGHTKSIRFCHDLDCSIWFLRFGKYPKTYIRENGKSAEQLFNPGNFKKGAKFDPKEPESSYKF